MHPNHCAPTAVPLGVQEALRWAEQATEIRAYAADALALQAGLHLEKRDYHHAKQVGSRRTGCGGWLAVRSNGSVADLASPVASGVASELPGLPGGMCTLVSSGASSGPCHTQTMPPYLLPARQVLDRLLEAEDGRKHETFAKLAMANLHAYSAPSSRCAHLRWCHRAAGTCLPQWNLDARAYPCCCNLHAHNSVLSTCPIDSVVP